MVRSKRISNYDSLNWNCRLRCCHPALLSSSSSKFVNEFESIFFVDPNLDQAEKIQREFGSGQILGNYKEIMSDLQGAIVVVPNHLHFTVAKDFLNCGVNVLCEKPLAVSPD